MDESNPYWYLLVHSLRKACHFHRGRSRTWTSQCFITRMMVGMAKPRPPAAPQGGSKTSEIQWGRWMHHIDLIVLKISNERLWKGTVFSHHEFSALPVNVFIYWSNNIWPILRSYVALPEYMIWSAKLSERWWVVIFVAEWLIGTISTPVALICFAHPCWVELFSSNTVLLQRVTGSWHVLTGFDRSWPEPKI